MLKMKWGFIVVSCLILFTGIANAGLYECDMGWTDNSPTALSPVSGSGPIVNVTFSSSKGFTTDTENGRTSIGYQHGGSFPTISMTFSSDVTNVELSIVDLDNPWEDLDTMSPVPSSTTGDLYISGSTVKSNIDNGAGSIIYDTINADETLTFRFDDQLSNLALVGLSFETIDHDDGLVAYYPFCGNANDESGNGHDGSVQGPILTQDRFDYKNSAYSFDGEEDVINLPNEVVNTLSNITSSIWVKTLKSEEAFLNGASPSNQNDYMIHHHHDYTTALYEGLTVYVKQQAFCTYVYINDDLWHHIVVLRNGSSGLVQIYLDGESLGSTILPAGTLSIGEGGLMLGREQDILGGGFDNGRQDFSGKIDDLRIYNRLLSEQEIEELFNTKPTCQFADGFIISAPSGFEAPAGETVSVPISLTNTESVEIEGIDITIEFDESIIDAQGATLVGGVLESESYSIQTNITEIGKISLALSANSDLFSDEGVLCYVQFQAVGNPGDISDLTFTKTIINEEDVDFQNGSVIIIDVPNPLSGTVNYYLNNAPVPDTSLNLTGDVSYQTQTNTSGEYIFPNIPPGNYILEPSKTDDLGGLSATDASRISRHSVGLYSFSCMEKIAADVTQNGEISATDASRVARYSINLIGCLNDDANCKDWVFAPETIASCSTWPPISFTPQRNYSPLTGGLVDQNFIAIRLGDVTGNWTPDTEMSLLNTMKAPAAVALIASCEMNAAQNDILNIPIVLEQQAAIEGIDIKVTFNENILNATGVVLTGGILEGQNYSLQSNLNNAGEITMAISANSNLHEGTGTVAILEFSVVGDTGSTGLAFEKFDVNESPMTGKFGIAQDLCESVNVSVGEGQATGNISGTVTTQIFGQDVDVIGAMVNVAGTQITAVTDAAGNYTLTDVPTGIHELEILMDHFEPLTVSGINVATGATTPVPANNTILTLSYGYTQAELDAAVQAERDKWDANGDGQIGLDEAIRALQVIIGIE